MASFKIEQMPLVTRREVLAELLDSDGHNTPIISERLRAKGIDIGAAGLSRYWKSVRARLKAGDVILKELVKEIIAEKCRKADEPAKR